MIKELIGWRLIKIDDGGFEVEKNGETKHFVFEDDYGDCCGYNEITTNLLISEDDFAKNPVITEVEMVDVTKMHSDCDRLRITFMGECKPIAEIVSESGSGSGWCYGAHAWIVCKETNETEEMTSY